MTGTVERRMRRHYAATRARLFGPSRVLPQPPAPQPAPPQRREPTLAELFPYDESPPWRPPATCDSVITHVCAFYGVTRVDLVSARRDAAIVRPRQVAMHLARTLTIRSLKGIGAMMGDRDHATVLHGAKRIAEALGRDRALAREVAELARRICAREEPRPKPNEVPFT